MRIVTGVRNLVQMIRNGCTGRVLDDWAIDMSGDAMCGLHRACGDGERNFLS
jgi:hypothetical protein